MLMRRRTPLVILCGFPYFAFALEPVPPEAEEAIAAVHLAASKNDFKSLKAMMVREFTWSFGGDNSSEQAIASWRADPEAMAVLAEVTSKQCGPISKEYIQCPQQAGISFRAGFTQTTSGWRMVYFVAGD